MWQEPLEAMLYFSGIKGSLSLPDSEGGCNIMESNIVGKLPPFSKEVKQVAVIGSHREEVNNF